MLAMRLARIGAKKKPSYRVIVIEKQRARNSRSVEILGHYNPTKNPIELSLNDERVQHWLSVGAEPSQTVKRLIAYKANPPAPREAKPAKAKAEEKAAAPAKAETAETEAKETAAAEEEKPEAAATDASAEPQPE